MISDHGENPIFFNKKNKDWTSRTLANPHSLHPITSHFCITLPPPPLAPTPPPPPPSPPQSGRHNPLMKYIKNYEAFCDRILSSGIYCTKFKISILCYSANKAIQQYKTIHNILKTINNLQMRYLRR